MTGYNGRIQQFAATMPSLPGFLRGHYGATFLESLGLSLDVARARDITGVRQAYPLACEPSALSSIGGDRGLRKYDTETEESYRLRLAQWYQIHSARGRHIGEMRNLQPYFQPESLPMIRTVHQCGDGLRATWHTLYPDGSYEVHRASPSNWDWDSAIISPPVPLWSRFWVIVYMEGTRYSPPPTWDGGELWDGGALWDGGPSAAEIADIVGLIKEAKAAHSWLSGVWFTWNPDRFRPTDIGAGEYPDGTWRYAFDHTTGDRTWPTDASLVYNYPDP